MRHRPNFRILIAVAAPLLAGPCGAPAAEGAEEDARALIDAAARLAADNRPVEALAKAEDAYFAVWSRLPLAFRETTLIEGAPGGPGRFEPRAGHAYAAGETISVYVEPIGFGWRRVDGRWETDLAADFILATEAGRIIAGQKGFAAFRMTSPRRQPDPYLTIDYRFAGVPPGDYVLTTTMHDRVDGEAASFDQAITID